MKAERIIDMLKSFDTDGEIVSITIKKDKLTIESENEILTSELKIKMTELCPKLARMTVRDFQKRLHANYPITKNTSDLQAFEKMLRIEDKAYRILEIVQEGD